MKKFYGMNVDLEVMEEFKAQCRLSDVKYSNKIEELLNDFNNGNLVSLGNIEVALHNVKATVNVFKEMAESLDRTVNPVEDDCNESEDFEMGDFDE